MLLGSQGGDVFLGGDGDDFVFGDNGNDLALLGANDDVFQWDPGDGNDTVEGQDGRDRMMFFGSNVAERIDIVANGGRVLFLRDVASVSMDLNDLETIEYRVLGGADNIAVGDLSGTDVTRIELDLRGPDGGGDGAVDTITVNGTQGADVFGAAGDSGGVTVFGLHTRVDIFHQEQENDRRRRRDRRDFARGRGHPTGDQRRPTPKVIDFGVGREHRSGSDGRSDSQNDSLRADQTRRAPPCPPPPGPCRSRPLAAGRAGTRPPPPAIATEPGTISGRLPGGAVGQGRVRGRFYLKLAPPAEHNLDRSVKCRSLRCDGPEDSLGVTRDGVASLSL